MKSACQPKLYLNVSHQYWLDTTEGQIKYKETEKGDYFQKLSISSENISKQDILISYLYVDVDYKISEQESLSFSFTVDEYGFYFFESKENLTKDIIKEFFGGKFFYDSSKDKKIEGSKQEDSQLNLTFTTPKQANN